MPSKGKGKKKKRSTFTKNLMAGLLSISENYIKLQKLIDQKAGKVSYINKDLQRINRNTVRVVSDNLKTKAGEFVFTDGKDVKGGIDYHIHYTKCIYYMYYTYYIHYIHNVYYVYHIHSIYCNI